MEQRSSSPRALRARSSHQVLPFSSRYVPYVPIELPTQPDSRTLTPPRVRIRRRAVRQVAVLEVAGRLDNVVGELDHAIQLALAHGPRGVICDLSGVLEGATPAAIEVLATAGRHVRDWPGIPIAVACPDLHLRERLCAHPLGAHLIVTTSLFCAVTAVLETPYLMVPCRILVPHPTAPRAARDFVTRTLLDWRLNGVIPLAGPVASELVASSTVHSGSDIYVSVVWDRGALRLTVQDHGPALPGQSFPPNVHQRGLSVVAALSRAWGALPAEDGGEVVWAVFDAPRPSTGDDTRASRPEPAKGAVTVAAS